MPFNREAYPNYFSFYYYTKKGVTIHEIDKNLNTVRIVVCGCSTVEQNDLDREPKFDPELTWPKSMENNKIQQNSFQNHQNLKFY